MSDQPDDQVNDQTPRLVVSWLLVAVMLGYGIVETVITAVKLFQ
jgi:hypothetical protein